MQQLMTTKEVAERLGVNEKKVYALIAEKSLPATKVTGKWLFPSALVDRWVESNTVNHPGSVETSLSDHGPLIIAGSDDILLKRAMSLYMRRHPGRVAAFASMGSKGGLDALRRNQCHLAASHLLEEAASGREFNFSHAGEGFSEPPALVNFSRREQGFMLPAGNPKGVTAISDIPDKSLRVVNRSKATGTRLLFDRELTSMGVDPATVDGYDDIADTHLEVGMAVLSGRADIGPGIRAAATMLGLDFISLGWERFDFLIHKEGFFDKSVQLFLGLLLNDEFRAIADELSGYDTSRSGRMLFQNHAEAAGRRL